MNQESTTIGGIGMTPILERPPLEPGVSRGDACFFCPELRERVTQTHTLVTEYHGRLTRIEAKLDEVKSSTADVTAIFLKETAQRDKELSVDIAVLKGDVKRNAAVISAVVSGIIAFIWWLFGRTFDK